MSESLKPLFSFDGDQLTIRGEVTIGQLSELISSVFSHRAPISKVLFEHVTVMDSAAIVLLLACRRTISGQLIVAGASQKLRTLIRLYDLDSLFLLV